MKSVPEGDREPILHRFLGTEMVVHGILLYSLLSTVSEIVSCCSLRRRCLRILPAPASLESKCNLHSCQMEDHLRHEKKCRTGKQRKD